MDPLSDIHIPSNNPTAVSDDANEASECVLLGFFCAFLRVILRSLINTSPDLIRIDFMLPDCRFTFNLPLCTACGTAFTSTFLKLNQHLLYPISSFFFFFLAFLYYLAVCSAELFLFSGSGVRNNNKKRAVMYSFGKHRCSRLFSCLWLVKVYRHTYWTFPNSQNFLLCM